MPSCTSRWRRGRGLCVAAFANPMTTPARSRQSGACSPMNSWPKVLRRRDDSSARTRRDAPLHAKAASLRQPQMPPEAAWPEPGSAYQRACASSGLRRSPPRSGPRREPSRAASPRADAPHGLCAQRSWVRASVPPDDLFPQRACCALTSAGAKVFCVRGRRRELSRRPEPLDGDSTALGKTSRLRSSLPRYSSANDRPLHASNATRTRQQSENTLRGSIETS